MVLGTVVLWIDGSRYGSIVDVDPDPVGTADPEWSAEPNPYFLT
jgi:hypothetical protein